MTSTRCYYCDQSVPQNMQNSHMRSEHNPPSAADQRCFYRKFSGGGIATGSQNHRPVLLTQGAAPAAPVSSASVPTPAPALAPAPPAGQRQGYMLFAENNTTQTTSIASVDDAVSSPVIGADHPQPTASLNKATKNALRDMVRAFDGLSDEDRNQCNIYIDKAYVFPGLTVFVFIHLKLCSTSDLSLRDFTSKMRLWKLKGEKWCIEHYADVRDYLCSLYRKSPVDWHVCNQHLIYKDRLHNLDVQHLGAQVASVVADADKARSFYASVEKHTTIAQSMVDLLQALLDLGPRQFEEWYRRHFLDALVRLSRKALIYPLCMKIKGIENSIREGGAGGFGDIYRGSLCGRMVALKRLRRGQGKLTKDFINEAVLWRNVDHANCVPFYGVFKPSDVEVYLVSPWMEHGDLSVYLDKNPDIFRLPLVYDIAKGLEYLHKMQPTIVHGDLKCSNIFVSSSRRACIADFGLSNLRDFDTKANSSINIGGTPGFMAPEMYAAVKKGRDSLLSLELRRCDMFSFGCVIYEIYTSKYLDEQDICDGKRPSQPTQAVYKQLGLDDDIWQLIEGLWKHNPEIRLGAKSARDFIRHKLRKQTGTALLEEDPEWDLEFLRATGSAMGPFQLR